MESFSCRELGTKRDVGLDVAFDVDDAALDLGLGPGVFDGFECALLPIGGHDQGGLELVEESAVVVGVFLGAPVPGHDVVGGAGDQEAFGVEVGAVDKQLVVGLPANRGQLVKQHSR